MEAELKIWLDFSSNEYGREATREDLADLFAAIRSLMGDARVQHVSQYGFISVANGTLADVEAIKKLSSQLRIPISCGLEERLTRAELRQVRFARLTIEGDYVDNDADGNPLNRFPRLLCPVCNMPDESKLPDPYYVRAKQMRRRRQDGVPGVALQTNREVFWCNCGVFVASERVKRILEVLDQPFTYASVAAADGMELPCPCWAIRPVQTWGRRRCLASIDPCPACVRPRRCWHDRESGAEALFANRLIMEDEAFPQADLVRSESWFGDRTKRPEESCDFSREVFVSGRLCEVLLRAKVRGLMTPDEVVAFGDSIPTGEPDDAKSWVNAKLKLLKGEALA